MQTAPIARNLDTAPVAATGAVVVAAVDITGLAPEEAAIAEAAAAEEAKRKAEADREALGRVQRMVSRWRNEMEQALKEALIDQDFYDGVQLTADELAILASRNQPPIVINRIKPAVNGIVGVIERGRTDPKAWPRTPNDEDSAELATDVLRFLADTNRLQALKSAAFREELIWGQTAAITLVSPETGKTQIKRIRPEELIWDPASRELDCADAQFLGIGKWRYADDLIREGAADIDIEGALTGSSDIDGGVPETAEDRPDIWADRDHRRVFHVELYYRNRGDWYRIVFVRGAVLEHGPSPYRDTEGRMRCPIEVQRAYVDRKNRPYGIIRDMRDSQRELNSRRSWILHALVARPFTYMSGSIADVEKFKTEIAKSNGAAELAMPEGVTFLEMAPRIQGQFELLAESKQEIERGGPNPGVLGRDVQGQSGRAILAQQQAGLLELSPIISGFDDFVLRLYRQMWACVQQFSTPEDYVRVTDDVGKAKFIQTREPVMGPDGQPALEYVIDPQTGQPAIDPQTGQPAVQPVMRERMAEADVDLVLDSSPDTAVIEEEQFQKMVETLPVIAGIQNPQVQAAIPSLIKGIFAASSLRNKRDLADAMDTQAQPDPMAQMAMQMQAAAAEADIAKTQSETGKNEATALKTNIEAANIMRQAEREDMGLDPASQDRELQLNQLGQQQDTAAG